MSKGIGIPITMTRNIYGEEMEFTITPLKRKDAEKLDSKSDKKCDKVQKELLEINELISTYEGELTHDERVEHRKLIGRRRELISTDNKCREDAEKKFSIFLHKLISPAEAADAIEENAGAETGVMWAMNEYQVELGKLQQE